MRPQAEARWRAAPPDSISPRHLTHLLRRAPKKSPALLLVTAEKQGTTSDRSAQSLQRRPTQAPGTEVEAQRATRPGTALSSSPRVTGLPNSR